MFQSVAGGATAIAGDNSIIIEWPGISRDWLLNLYLLAIYVYKM